MSWPRLRRLGRSRCEILLSFASMCLTGERWKAPSSCHLRLHSLSTQMTEQSFKRLMMRQAVMFELVTTNSLASAMLVQV